MKNVCVPRGTLAGCAAFALQLRMTCYGQTEYVFLRTLCNGGTSSLKIISIWAGYFAAFVAYLLFTLGAHLKESPPPPPIQGVDTSNDQPELVNDNGEAPTTASCSTGPDCKPEALHRAEILKVLFMYLQYLGGIIAKLPVQWPGALDSIFSSLGRTWGWVMGSAASMDCLLLSMNGGQELRAARAGWKGLISLLAPAVMFGAVVLLRCGGC